MLLKIWAVEHRTFGRRVDVRAFVIGVEGMLHILELPIILDSKQSL